MRECQVVRQVVPLQINLHQPLDPDEEAITGRCIQHASRGGMGGGLVQRRCGSSEGGPAMWSNRAPSRPGNAGMIMLIILLFLGVIADLAIEPQKSRVGSGSD